MRLTNKASLSAIVLITLLMVVLLVVSLIAFRQFSIHTAESHAQSVAEVVRVSMTEAMINGVIQHRSSFLERMQEVKGLNDVYLVRGQHVVAQYGAGLASERAVDDIDRQVLLTGQAVSTIIDEQGMSPTFRTTIPYIASSEGEPNCLNCHQVKNGDVLGAVTITLSVGQQKERALLTITIITLCIGLFAAIILFIIGRLIRPITRTTSDIQAGVKAAISGDFQYRVEVRSNDEIGEIANQFNQLTSHLEQGLNTIRNNVAQLIQCNLVDRNNHNNLLNSTISMVDGLIDASHFKQAIEEDESKLEVYYRLARVIEEEHKFSNYSIYEVTHNGSRLEPIVVNGDQDANGCHWCNPNVLVRSEICRARRTGHTIDSSEYPGICNAFAPPEDGQEYVHTCIPVIQSGTVGSVVQLIEVAAQLPRLRENTTMLYVYLREAAPVIEAKRLMDTLRESTLIDPMTGLNNRRFLEEYSDTIIATANRRQSRVSVLMLDLDYFKKVNDTYGHDAGDKVLKALAQIFRNSVRASDLVIRYGGEEFIILLQDSNSDMGEQVAEKVRANVEAHLFTIPGAELKKTISVGVADFPDDSDTFWQTIKFADVALYQAKDQGRNRVVRFTKEMWQNQDY
ncbi:diguanylate cyclase [Ectothiorhodospiraceae bacterium BW-2]|nr:diguanylate cyclase [Ectothiorhodospiraceae bacterium BW-2]